MDPYRGSMGDPLSLNRYVYCGNDPVNFIDPSGFLEDDIGSGSGSGTCFYVTRKMTNKKARIAVVVGASVALVCWRLKVPTPLAITAGCMVSLAFLKYADFREGDRISIQIIPSADGKVLITTIQVIDSKGEVVSELTFYSPLSGEPGFVAPGSTIITDNTPTAPDDSPPPSEGTPC